MRVTPACRSTWTIWSATVVLTGPLPASRPVREELVDLDLVVVPDDLAHQVVHHADHPAVLERVVGPVPADAADAAELDDGPLAVGEDPQHLGAGPPREVVVERAPDVVDVALLAPERPGDGGRTGGRPDQ